MKRTWLLILSIALILATLSWTVVLAAPPAQGDQAIITSPQNNAVVRGQVAIVGSAVHSQFQFYKIEYAREPVVGEAWTIIGAIHQQQVTDGQLETWDTSQLPDGSYTLRLRVVRLDGNYSEYSVVQVVVANAQPTETPTPEVTATSKPPTITPTPLPPTPTIIIEQPVVTNSLSITGTAALAVTRTPLPTPVGEEGGGFNLDVAPLQTACLYGAGVGLGIFLLFGFMAALRNLIYALISRR
jgi:hypothetical protein